MRAHGGSGSKMSTSPGPLGNDFYYNGTFPTTSCDGDSSAAGVRPDTREKGKKRGDYEVYKFDLK